MNPTTVLLSWTGDPGDRRILTAADAGREAGRLAAALRAGGRVAIHLPPVPERPIALWACRAAGAEAVVCEAPSDVAAATPDVVVTCDARYEDGWVVPMKDAVDDALGDADVRVVVVERAGCVALSPAMDAYLSVEMRPGRDVWWHDLPEGAPVDVPAEPMELRGG